MSLNTKATAKPVTCAIYKVFSVQQVEVYLFVLFKVVLYIKSITIILYSYGKQR